MKKIRRAEFLAAVAIITSAAVLQIREHMIVHDAAPANAADAQWSCDSPHRGLLPASCEPTSGTAPPEHNRATRHLRNTSKIWV